MVKVHIVKQAVKVMAGKKVEEVRVNISLLGLKFHVADVVYEEVSKRVRVRKENVSNTLGSQPKAQSADNGQLSLAGSYPFEWPDFKKLEEV